MSLRMRVAGLAATLLPVMTIAQTPDNAELLRRLEEQEQRVKVLERRLENQEEVTTTAAASTATVRATPNRFSLQSADGANVLRLRGTLHFDGRRFIDDVTPETADTWLLRRVRPTIEGTVGGIYDFRFTPDFAGGKTIILDAYLAARLKPWAVITAGKFKVPVGLERWVAANDLRFIERAFPTGLLPNRDLGAQLSGEVAEGLFSYSLGYFNGVTDGGSSDGNLPTPDAESDTNGDWAARVFFQPFLNSDNFALRSFGFGIGGTYVDTSGSAANPLLTTYRTPGQQVFWRYRANTTALPAGATFADGERLRWTPQFYYYVGRYGLLGEYAKVSQDVTRVTAAGSRSGSLDTAAWQLAFSWFITGEDETFRGFTPVSTFTPGKSGWGAWELVARYHQLSFDDAAFAGGAASFVDPATNPSKASAIGVGVNWYLNQAVKWSLNYEVTNFEGGAAGGADRPDEQAILTRFAIGF